MKAPTTSLHRRSCGILHLHGRRFSASRRDPALSMSDPGKMATQASRWRRLAPAAPSRCRLAAPSCSAGNRCHEIPVEPPLGHSQNSQSAQHATFATRCEVPHSICHLQTLRVGCDARCRTALEGALMQTRGEDWHICDVPYCTCPATACGACTFSQIHHCAFRQH